MTTLIRAWALGGVFTLALAVLGLTLLLSLAHGAVELPLSTVWQGMTRPDGSNESLIVQTLRLPRTLVAALAGAGLAVSGLLLQAVTRNPLADPGILGVEAGAALAIVTAVVLFPGLAAAWLVPLAFAGGLLAAGLAYSVARGIGQSPLRLALAGVAVAAVGGALTRALLILFEERAQGLLFLLSGTVAGRGFEQLAQVSPWALLAMVAALLLCTRVNVLALGQDIARSLGSRAERDTLLVTATAVLLAAASVSLVGPVGFVGLIVPHLARALIGHDHRLSLPLAATLGASLLVGADVAARLIDRPAETPVGILIAAIGAPFFVMLARRIGRS